MSRTRTLRGLALGLTLALGALSLAPPDDAQTPRALAQARLALAREMYGRVEEMLKAPPAQGGAEASQQQMLDVLEFAGDWSQRWMESERDVAAGKPARTAALAAHVARLKHWEAEFKPIVESRGMQAQNRYDAFRYRRLEAEYALAKARAE